MSYDKVSLLLPMNGANNGTVFTDWSPVPKTVARFGDTKTATAQSKYYGSSTYFDGTGDYLTVPNSAGFNFETDRTFTLECWCRFDDVTSRRILAKGSGSTTQRQWGITTNAGGGFAFLWSDSSGAEHSVVSTSVLSALEWIHIAASCSAGSLKLFINGTEDGSGTVSSLRANISNVDIGTLYAGVGGFMKGYMQDLRITKGAALYTTNFTPPARLLGTIDNSAVGASKILDVNGDPAERTVFAVPRVAPTRVWSDVSNASGEFEIQAPAGVDHSVVALADETGLRNDIVHRVIPV